MARYSATVTPASASRAAPDAHRSWRAPWPLLLQRSLAPVRRGRFDPCHVHVGDRVVWRTARPASGPVLARIEQLGGDEVRCEAWGEGADWFVEQLPQLLGADDTREQFRCDDHPLLARIHDATPWLRLPRTDLVFEALVGAILEQRVTVREALDARSWLIRRHGEAPPGCPPDMPPHMRVMPTPGRWLQVPSWDWHRAGVDVHRAATVRRCAEVAARLEETTRMDREACMRRLRAVPGVGVWTVAETLQRSHGDADSLSYGDTHLARFVGYALTGAAADDARMEELLEPWRGHRHRVVRLLQVASASGLVRRPPRVPRARPRAHLGF